MTCPAPYLLMKIVSIAAQNRRYLPVVSPHVHIAATTSLTLCVNSAEVHKVFLNSPPRIEILGRGTVHRRIEGQVHAFVRFPFGCRLHDSLRRRRFRKTGRRRFRRWRWRWRRIRWGRRRLRWRWAFSRRRRMGRRRTIAAFPRAAVQSRPTVQPWKSRQSIEPRRRLILRQSLRSVATQSGSAESSVRFTAVVGF